MIPYAKASIESGWALASAERYGAPETTDDHIHAALDDLGRALVTAQHVVDWLEQKHHDSLSIEQFFAVGSMGVEFREVATALKVLSSSGLAEDPE